MIETFKLVEFKTGSPYAQTTVPFDKSLSQIKALLTKHGCNKIAIQEDRAGDYPRITLLFMKDELPYIIEFPVTYILKAKTGRELKMEISGRIIHDRLKSLLIEVDINMSNFAQAMMRFIALPSADGRFVALESRVIEQADRIQRGQFDLVALPPAKGPC